MIVHNVTDNPVRFEWDMRHPRFTKIFEVQPTAGSLQPGECCVCRVRLKANVPEAYKFDACCRVWDEYEEEQYEAALRELQRQAEEAEEDEAMGGQKKQRRKWPRSGCRWRPCRRCRTTRSRSLRRTFKRTGTLGQTARRWEASGSRLGTARSNVSGLGSTTGSALTRQSSADRDRWWTAVSFTEAPEDDGAFPSRRVRVGLTTVSATVAVDGDASMLTRPASEHYVVEGRPGAEALLSETAG